MNDAQFEQIIGEILQGESEPEEGLGFLKKAFKKIKRVFKKKAGTIRKALKKVVGGAAVIVGGVYGGPAGAAAGMQAYQLLNVRRRKAGLPPVMLPEPLQEQLPLNDPRYVTATKDVAYQMMEGGPVQLRSPRARRAFGQYVESESNRLNIMKWAVPGVIGAVVVFIAIATRGER